MVNKDAFAKRLEDLMKYYELSAATLADTIGVQRSSISHLLSGRNKPSLDFVIKILDNYTQISFEWLVKGIGTLQSSSLKEVNDQEKGHSPTLFDTTFSDEDDNEKPKKGHSLDNLDMNQGKSIAKMFILYADGSFEVFDKPLN